MVIFIDLILFTFIVYVVLLNLFTFAWYSNGHNKFGTSKKVKIPKISIIIAARNEEVNIIECISSILRQTIDIYEIIIVNDHSTDETESKVRQLISDSSQNINLYNLPDNIFGKKSAIAYASEKAKGEVYFFTDADCVLKENHLELMISYMSIKNYDMLCGPVDFKKKKGILNKLINLEFLTIIGSSSAGFFLKKPFICNAANIMIKRSIFAKAQNNINDKYASGDDVFLLHYLLSIKAQVGFINSRDCIVKTNPPESIKSLFNQRLRWASKSVGYKNISGLSMSLIILFVAIAIILSFILSLYELLPLNFFIYLIILKTIVESIFLLPVLKFYKKTNLFLYIPILQLVHPIYILITGLGSLFIKPTWKGRKI